MNIKKMLSKERIILNLKGRDKQEVLNELADTMGAAGSIIDRESYRSAVLKREKECSTGIGFGIAIPHGMCKEVLKAVIVFGRSKIGIEYGSIDGAPVHLFFMLAIPEGEYDLHLEVLSKISGKLMDAGIRERLMNTENYEEVIGVFD